MEISQVLGENFLILTKEYFWAAAAAADIVIILWEVQVEMEEVLSILVQIYWMEIRES